MTRYLLDTGIASDLINRRLDVERRAAERVQAGDVIGISTPVLGELVGGIEGSDAPQRRMHKLHAALSRLKLWPYDKAAAFQFGRIQADLRRAGRPIQQVDIQSAAVAITLDCTVVTKDSDFRAVAGLKIEDWSV